MHRVSGRSMKDEVHSLQHRFEIIFLIVILLTLASAACSSKPQQTAPPQSVGQSSAVPETVKYEVRTVEKKDPDCSGEQSDCTYIKFVYPEIINGPSKVKAEINKAVSEFLRQSGEEGRSFESIDKAMESFIADYQQFKKEFPDAPFIYTDDRKINVAYESPRILSLEFDHGWFTGGAHPNSARTLVSYDIKTGEKIELADILIEDYKAELDKIGEKKFREVRQITSDMKLGEAGFDFDSEGFTLNDNFFVSKDGLVFYFNPYEVGPYAAGPTEVALSFADLKPLIRADGPLADMAK